MLFFARIRVFVCSINNYWKSILKYRNIKLYYKEVFG